jgi:hypothetical protein
LRKHQKRSTPQRKASLSAAQQALANRMASTVKQELANVVRQMEAHSNLLATLNGAVALPQMRGWPISPDFGMLLAELMDATPYDVVVEFGSGVSTFILAALLAKPGAYPNVQTHVALEHLEHFQQQTMHWLALLPSLARTQVWHCPLAPMALQHDGASATYSYYAAAAGLEQHLRALPKPVNRVLAVVDGPPGSTGRWARYPAVTLLMKLLPDADLHILLDDHGRTDEKETGQAWVKLLELNGYVVTVEKPRTEKGALFIKATKQSNITT